MNIHIYTYRKLYFHYVQGTLNTSLAKPTQSKTSANLGNPQKKISVEYHPQYVKTTEAFIKSCITSQFQTSCTYFIFY